MRNLFIFLSIVFISSPLFSQVDIYEFDQTRFKSFDSRLQQLPESLREKLQLLIPAVAVLRGVEFNNLDGRVPNDFFAKMTVRESGLQETYTYYRWDILTQDWSIDPYLQYINTYDSNGYRIERLLQNWDGTVWVNESIRFSTYDTNGLLTEWLYQTWDGTGWVNNWRDLYTHDTNGNITEYLSQIWNGTVWVNDWQLFYTYDSNGFLTEWSLHTWGGTAWMNAWRRLFTYDMDGNLTVEIYQEWDGTVWVNDYIVYVDYTSIVGVEESEIIPKLYSLEQNYPNPFNPETVIEYTLPIRSDVKLTIYNLRGEEVALLIDGTMPAGNHQVSWDASGFASGIYFYRLQADDFVQTKKMLLLK